MLCIFIANPQIAYLSLAHVGLELPDVDASVRVGELAHAVLLGLVVLAFVLGAVHVGVHAEAVALLVLVLAHKLVAVEEFRYESWVFFNISQVRMI